MELCNAIDVLAETAVLQGVKKLNRNYVRGKIFEITGRYYDQLDIVESIISNAESRICASMGGSTTS